MTSAPLAHLAPKLIDETVSGLCQIGIGAPKPLVGRWNPYPCEPELKGLKARLFNCRVRQGAQNAAGKDSRKHGRRCPPARRRRAARFGSAELRRSVQQVDGRLSVRLSSICRYAQQL